MMITVDDKEMPWRSGMTVSELLKELPEKQDCAVVRLNGRTVSRPRFDSTVIPDQAEVILIPMIAGG